MPRNAGIIGPLALAPTTSVASGVYGIPGQQRAAAWPDLPPPPLSGGTGGTITTETIDGVEYKIHSFTSSGTFEVTGGEGTLEYLVCAGGGAGGSHGGGGGGGGGVRSSVVGKNSGGGASAETAPTISAATVLTVTVGAGASSGSPGVTSSIVRSSGGAFSTVTTVGGGLGTYHGAYDAGAGGSGGCRRRCRRRS